MQKETMIKLLFYGDIQAVYSFLPRDFIERKKN